MPVWAEENRPLATIMCVHDLLSSGEQIFLRNVLCQPNPQFLNIRE